MNEICGPTSVSIRGFQSRQYHYGREESETVLCRAIAGKMSQSAETLLGPTSSRKLIASTANKPWRSLQVTQSS